LAPIVRKIDTGWPAKLFELSDVKILIYLYGKKIGRDITTPELRRRVLKNQRNLGRSLGSLLDYGLIEKRTKSDPRTNVTYVLTWKGRKFAKHLVSIRNLVEDPDRGGRQLRW
jgi:DNA-binding HxlR family transcriptional regulator